MLEHGDCPGSQKLPSFSPASPASLKKELNLPPSSKLSAEHFFGRETFQRQVEHRIRRKDDLIVISGLGGIGKTELAVRIGKDYRDGKVYFARFNTDFKTTICRTMATGIKNLPAGTSMDENTLYGEVMALLEQCSENDLIIIDNVDSKRQNLSELMREPAFTALKELKPHLLITTRLDYDGAIKIPPLPDQELDKIFDRHKCPATPEQRKALIRAVNGHTLTVDLIARTLTDGHRRLDPDKLLKALRENVLPKETYQKISVDYNASDEQMQIYQHLRNLFNVTGLTEAETLILQCATLLPSSGLDGEVFDNSFPTGMQERINWLIKHGWLSGGDNKISIHPVIRMVCLEELQPTEESCGDFLTAVWAKYTENEYTLDIMSQMAELFGRAADALNDPEAKWANIAGLLWTTVAAREVQTQEDHAYINFSGSFWNAREQYAKAKEHYEKLLPKLEKQLAAQDPALATAYSHMGTACGGIGDHEDALKFKLNAKKILCVIYPPDCDELAAIYYSLYQTCQALEKHPDALDYLLQAVKIWENQSAADPLWLLPHYKSVCIAYSNLHQYDKMIVHLKKIETMLTASRTACQSDLAAVYRDMGIGYYLQNNYECAETYLQDAIKILEKIVPQDLDSLSSAYIYLSNTYLGLDNKEMHLHYLKQVMDIKCILLPPNDPELANYYGELCGTCERMGKFRDALQYGQKELNIWKTLYSTNHFHVQHLQSKLHALQELAMQPSR